MRHAEQRTNPQCVRSNSSMQGKNRRRAGPRAWPEDVVHLTLMLMLTFSTGVVDAVGYLGLDRVFTGNMTGNVVILGMGLVGADDLPILGPVLALVGFMVGAAIGGRALRQATRAWTAVATTLFASVALIILGLATLLFIAGNTPAEPLAVITTTLLGIAMGVQAATARFIAVKDVTTVVVTSTITGLAAESVLGSGKSRAGGSDSPRRIVAVLLILVGAAAGALLLRWHIGAGLVLAGVVVLVVCVAGGLVARREVA